MKWLDDFIVSERGQWDHPRKRTAVRTDNGIITMQGVPYPVMGFVPGHPPIIMQPGGKYQFPGKMVYEIPMAYGGDISIPDLSRPNWLDKAQKGQQVKYYDDLKEFKKANRAYQDSLSLYNQYPAPEQYQNRRAPSWGELQSEFNNHRFRNNSFANSGIVYFPSIQNDQFAIDQKGKSGIAPIYLAPDPNISSLYTYVYKKPTQKPVYKEKPKEYIPTKTPRLEREPLQLVIPQSDRTLMPYNNTRQVLRGIQEEDKSDKNLYPTRVVPAPTFKTGGWLTKYQDGSQVKANIPGYNSDIGPTVKNAELLKEQKLREAARSSQSLNLPSGALDPTLSPVDYAFMPSLAAPIIRAAMAPKKPAPTEIPPHLIGYSSPYYGNPKNPTPNKFFPPDKPQSTWSIGEMKPGRTSNENPLDIFLFKEKYGGWLDNY